MSRWHCVVLAAWLRRIISHVPPEPGSRGVVASRDYHPAKGQKIYDRYNKIIDQYA